MQVKREWGDRPPSLGEAGTRTVRNARQVKMDIQWGKGNNFKIVRNNGGSQKVGDWWANPLEEYGYRLKILNGQATLSQNLGLQGFPK